MSMNEELYKKFLDKWGQNAQLLLCVEECSELIQAITKFVNGRGGDGNIIKEMADVDIMIEQLKFIFLIDEALRDNYEKYKTGKLQITEAKLND